MVSSLIHFLSAVIGAAWDVVTLGRPEEMGLGIGLAIALVAGASVVCGQAGMLALNKVTPARTGLTMATAAISAACMAAIMTASAVVVCRAVLLLPVTMGHLAPYIFASFAPHWLGFCVILPYTGMLVARLLKVWQLVCLWALLAAALPVNGMTALGIAFATWLSSIFVDWLVSTSPLGLRARILRFLSGTKWVNPREFLEGARP